MLDPNIAAWIRQNAAATVEVSRANGVNLDYTVVTLLTASMQLSQAQRWYQQAADAGDPSRNEVVNRTASQIGCYVGEVMVRNFGAEWHSLGNQVWLQKGSEQFPIFQIVLDDLTTGKTNLFNATSRITGKSFAELAAEHKSGASYDAAALAREMQEAAAIAVREVKGLDYSHASLTALQGALVKLQGMIASSPEHKDAIIKASLKKFGAYLGEVLVKHHSGVWMKGVVNFPPEMPVLGIASTYAAPQLLVRAVLEKQTLLMSSKYRASSAMDFFEIAHRLVEEQLIELMGGDEQSVCAEMSQDAEIGRNVYRHVLLALHTAIGKWNTALDFRPESLSGLEGILGRLYELAKSSAPGSGPTEKQRTTMALMWGTYLGEVVRRKQGGAWIAGPDAGQVQLQLPSGETLDPVEDVHARMMNGAADVIPNYYKRVIGAPVAAAAPEPAGVVADAPPPPTPAVQEPAPQEHAVQAEVALPPPPVVTDPEAEAKAAQQAEIARQALALAAAAVAEVKRTQGLALDYSIFSLQLLDQVVVTLRSQADLDRAQLANMLGCYFCEVVRRTNGGEWCELNGGYALQNGPVLVDAFSAVVTMFSCNPTKFGKAHTAHSLSKYYLLLRPVIGINFTQLLHGVEESEAALHGVLLPHSKANAMLYESLRSVLVHAYCDEGALLAFDRSGIEKAEQILQKYSTALKGPQDEEQPINIAKLSCWFGVFLGEVMRRQLGATWIVEPSKDQREVVGMQLGEAKFWPLHRVHKRLMGDWEASIVFYYTAVTKMAHEGPSALTAENSAKLR